MTLSNSASPSAVRRRMPVGRLLDALRADAQLDDAARASTACFSVSTKAWKPPLK